MAECGNPARAAPKDQTAAPRTHAGEGEKPLCDYHQTSTPRAPSPEPLSSNKQMGFSLYFNSLKILSL